MLDDNRLYRRTDPPPPPPPQRPKKKPKSRSSRASRTSKRTSTAAAEEGSDEESKDTNDASAVAAFAEDPFKWECVAVTLEEYQAFLETLQKTKDADEKYLRDSIVEHVLPILEKAEEAQQRKRQKREKELLNLQLVAGAKRSSRLAAKEEKERQEREAAEAAEKREHDLAEARKEQAKQHKLEEDRQSRTMTREQRIRDREQKRLLHEAELERIAEEQERISRGESRVSSRNLQADLEKSQKTLAGLTQDDQWIFDCSGCGVYGENLVSFSFQAHASLNLTFSPRMMEVIVLPAKNATFGSIASASVYHKKRPKRKTFTLSAETASKKNKMPASPNFHPSSSG